MRIVQNITDGTAISYLLAYKCLLKKHNEVQTFYHTTGSGYLFPLITIAAFSCEVALKNLLFLESGINMREHDLYSLFVQLKDKSRKRYMDQTIDLYNMKSRALNCNELFAQTEFTECLFKNRDVYTKCRYIYEGAKAVNLDFLEAFMFSLNDLCEEYERI